MSQPLPLWAIYVDGETKTGKGAASLAIAEALKKAGYSVYYDVAGDYYRRYTALVRSYLDLDEGDALPLGEPLLAAAQAVHQTRQAYAPDPTLGNLQRSAISRSVSVLGALPFVQTAAIEWYRMAVENALAAGNQVMVLDGRNPRARVAESNFSAAKLQTALDFYMTCQPAEAARRTLIGRGVETASTEQIERETRHVMERRDRDRQRSNRPFIAPEPSLLYVSETTTPAQAIAQTWRPAGSAELPTAIKFDNTKIQMADMLQLVAEIGLSAVGYAAHNLA